MPAKQCNQQRVLEVLMRRLGGTVERLQEWRTALITAAVAGKIDVRKAQIDLRGAALTQTRR